MGKGTKYPDPPPNVDPGEATRSYIEAMADPELQQLILDAESQFGPQYLENALARQDAALFGIGDTRGLAEISQEAAPLFGQIQADLQRQQREADIADVELFGGRATSALRASDPERMRLLEQQQALTDDLYARARGVTPQQARMAQQSAREAYQDRGRELGNASIFAEALGREEFMRQNRAEAQQSGAGLFNMLGMFGGDPYQQILGRPSTALPFAQSSAAQALGVGSNLGPALFNPDAGINLALQNNANRANFDASVFGAQQAARGSAWGGGLTGLGSVLGGAFGLF